MPVVTASVNSVIASGNIIAAAAAAASGSGSIHGAVTSAITHVAVTAVAIASGACLSTKVDFLWPKVEDKPGPFFSSQFIILLFIEIGTWLKETGFWVGVRLVIDYTSREISREVAFTCCRTEMPPLS